MKETPSEEELRRFFKGLKHVFAPTELEDGTPIPKDVDAKKALYDERLARFCIETDPDKKRDYGTDAYVLWVEWCAQAGIPPGYWRPLCPEK